MAPAKPLSRLIFQDPFENMAPPDQFVCNTSGGSPLRLQVLATAEKLRPVGNVVLSALDLLPD